MALVYRYTKGYPQPTPAAGYGFQSNAWLESKANVKAITFNIAATNGDSVNSIYKLGRVPSGSILLPESTLYAAAIAGATNVSVGLNNLNGTVLDTALMSAVDIHAGGSFSMLSNVAIANYNYRAWQLLGLSADPNAMLDVEMLISNALTASGAIAGFLKYLDIGV